MTAFQYSPWFEDGIAGFKVIDDRGIHLYTVRMYRPDKLGAVRIEILDPNNKVLHSKLFSIFL